MLVRNLATLGLLVLLGGCVDPESIGKATVGVGGAGGTVSTGGQGETGGAAGGGTSTSTSSGGSGGVGATGGTSAVSTLATATLAQCGISTIGSSNVQQIAIPSALTGSNWGIKDSACQQGGWDLSLCAGQTATFTSLDTGTTDQWGSVTVWVVTSGSSVCCVYKSDNSNPGISSAPCGRDAQAKQMGDLNRMGPAV